MWHARTKHDLIIEIWEKLDCENIGAAEIEAIEAVISDQYGPSAIESPMVIARLLADEGSELRHSEIMNLYVERASDRPYDAALRNIVNLSDLKSTVGSIRNLENLRLKYKGDGDKEGLRIVRETALRAKLTATKVSESSGSDDNAKQVNLEIAHWIRIWLETPEVFENWINLRQKSTEFINQFGDLDKTDLSL